MSEGCYRTEFTVECNELSLDAAAWAPYGPYAEAVCVDRRRHLQGWVGRDWPDRHQTAQIGDPVKQRKSGILTARLARKRLRAALEARLAPLAAPLVRLSHLRPMVGGQY